MKLRKQQYNTQQHTDSNALSQALQKKPEVVSSYLTHLGGRHDEKFPLSALTEGVGYSESVESLQEDEYQYPIIGKMDKAVPLAETVTASNPGVNGTSFKAVFPEKWFIKDYVIVSRSGVQYKIKDVNEGSNGSWEYTIAPMKNTSASAPSIDLEAGALFAQMYAPVAKDYSKGNASNWVAPGWVKHKLSTIRKSYSFSGNVKNQVVSLMDLPVGGGKTTNLWMDFEEFQHFLKWKEECEIYYWYGAQSYDNNGVTHLKDSNNYPIVTGPGLLEQIPNKETYSVLTEKLLKDIIGDLYYGMTSPEKKHLTLFTGTLGYRMFDEAMKDYLANKSFMQYNPGMFVTGSGRELNVGGFFKKYDHVDGHSLSVVKTNLFDHGPLGLTSQKHPIFNNMPLESGRMVFVDNSTYDGKPNLKMYAKKGREMLRWAVSGSVEPKGFETGPSRASDIDGASVHFLKTAHICLHRFDTSLDLRCVAS